MANEILVITAGILMALHRQRLQVLGLLSTVEKRQKQMRMPCHTSSSMQPIWCAGLQLVHTQITFGGALHV